MHPADRNWSQFLECDDPHVVGESLGVRQPAITFGQGQQALGIGMPAGTPTGQVNFVIDGGTIQSGPLTLTSGQITVHRSDQHLGSGTHSVVVEYLGSTNYGISNSLRR